MFLILSELSPLLTLGFVCHELRSGERQMQHAIHKCTQVSAAIILQTFFFNLSDTRICCYPKLKLQYRVCCTAYGRTPQLYRRRLAKKQRADKTHNRQICRQCTQCLDNVHSLVISFTQPEKTNLKSVTIYRLKFTGIYAVFATQAECSGYIVCNLTKYLRPNTYSIISDLSAT